MRHVLLISILGLIPLCSIAKGDDTALWKSFELIAVKGNINPGSVRINIPQTTDGSLADILNRNSALFVKYYSPGSLASTSMRGMGAQHTAIMWNGINLQSSMNSNMDLNLIPAFFVDQAVIETGANASSCGNGAIAGAIVLNNAIKQGKRIFADVSLGSFGQKNIGAGFSFQYKAFSSNSRIVYRYADYNYPYANYFKVDKPIEKMVNNRFKQMGFMQEFNYKIRSHTLYANICKLQTNRQLPAVLGASQLLNERQDDENTLLIIKHDTKLRTNLFLNSKLAYTIEKINYYNDQYKPAFNTAHTIIGESELKWKLKKGFEFVSSINYTHQKAWTDGYRSGVSRELISVLNKIQWNSLKPGLKLYAGNRSLMSDGVYRASAPDLGFEVQIKQNLRFKGNAACSFRLPSFNDFYWSPGGNPDLKPELGKKAELSIEYKFRNYKVGITSFFHRVDNWIMWLPNGGNANWKAFNAKQVESHGIEAAFENRWTINKNSFVKIFGRYQFVSSVNTAVYGDDKSLIGKQLFYTPYHTGFANLQYIVDKLRVGFGVTYTGSRFTSADNNPDNALKAYSLMSCSIAYDLNLKRYSSTLEFTTLNLMNTTYTVFENRPMPTRNFLISYKININYE